LARQKKLPLIAKTADKLDLYQRSVQTEGNIRFLANRFRLLAGRPLRLMREDFCGTALNCCEFVKLHPQNRAIGIDLDGSALRWCLQNNYPKLKESQWDRITLIQANVLNSTTPKVDLIVVLNYSYGIFKKRADLRNYLHQARKSLRKGGAITLDVATGKDLLMGFTSEGKFADFICISDWTALDSINHDYEIHISYRFKDGSQLRNAFNYRFRLWSLAELKDLLLEVGFQRVQVIMGFVDKKDPIYRERRHARFNLFRTAYALIVGQT